MTKKRISSRLVFLCGILLLLLACSTLSDLTGAGQTPTPEGGDTTTQIDLWLERTANLRSVNLDLVTEYSDRESKKVSAEIDSSGNMHLSIKVPLSAAFTADQPPDAPLPGDFELFIVDGRTYTRIGGEGEAAQDDSYLSMLADSLNGPEGPGLWLNILPEEDYTPAGENPYNGFTAAKYVVAGELENGTVSGIIFIDNQADALVGADLVVSGGLFFPPGSNRNGDVRIILTVQKADVPAVTLP